jgi:lipid-binding SYLF domain-containing protein
MTSFKRSLVLGAALLSAVSFSSVRAARAADTDQQATVNHALVTLEDLRHNKEFGTARQLMHQARAVLIAPSIFKAGFFFGGEGGNAVLLVRGPHGWSDPAFYTIASASFGLQIGAKESELVAFVMSDRALNALMRDKFQIGANAGIAVATLGSQVGGGTTAHAGADLIVWAASAGAFAGISLDGSVIAPRTEADADYYGRPVTSSEIVMSHTVRNPGASGLLRELNSLS